MAQRQMIEKQRLYQTALGLRPKEIFIQNSKFSKMAFLKFAMEKLWKTRETAQDGATC